MIKECMYTDCLNACFILRGLEFCLSCVTTPLRLHSRTLEVAFGWICRQEMDTRAWGGSVCPSRKWSEYLRREEASGEIAVGRDGPLRHRAVEVPMGLTHSPASYLFCSGSLEAIINLIIPWRWKRDIICVTKLFKNLIETGINVFS